MTATSGIVRTHRACRPPCSTVRSGRAPARPTDRTGRYDRDAVPDSLPATRSSAASSARPIDRDEPAPVAARDLSSAVLDTVVEVVIVFDPASWLISDVNRSACDVTGRTADAADRTQHQGRPGRRRGRAPRLDRRAHRGRDPGRLEGDDGHPATGRLRRRRSRWSSSPSPRRMAARRSSRSPATSASGSRSRSGSSDSPRPSTPGRPSSTRSSGPWARRSSCARPTGRSP